MPCLMQVEVDIVVELDKLGVITTFEVETLQLVLADFERDTTVFILLALLIIVRGF